MIEFFNILHITDLHYGQTKSSYEKGADVKDNDRSKKFKKHYQQTWENMFIDFIKNYITSQSDKIDYIAFTGDLGLSGKVNKTERKKRMELGILFLVQLCNTIDLNLNRLIIAPGNHDLDRNNSKDQFEDLKKLCLKHKILNCSTDNIVSIEISEGIKLFSINSCLGATEKISTFDKEYFSKQIDSLKTLKDYSSIEESLKNPQFLYQQDLDIPAIGDEQNNALISEISKPEVADACIILMHHNPVPTTCIEIRPYANLIDGGRLINSLLSSNKKIFILHGHTHFESRITSLFPDYDCKNYVAIIGSAALNGTNHGEASLLRFSFCNKTHLKTDIYEIKRNASLFKLDHKYEIFNKQASLDMDLHWHNIQIDKSYSFQELKRILNHQGNDDDLISKIVFWDPAHFAISRYNSGDIDKWKFTRIK